MQIGRDLSHRRRRRRQLWQGLLRNVARLDLGRLAAVGAMWGVEGRGVRGRSSEEGEEKDGKRDLLQANLSRLSSVVSGTAMVERRFSFLVF